MSKIVYKPHVVFSRIFLNVFGRSLHEIFAEKVTKNLTQKNTHPPNNNNSLYPELAPIPVSTNTHHSKPPAHKCAVGPEAALP